MLNVHLTDHTLTTGHRSPTHRPHRHRTHPGRPAKRVPLRPPTATSPSDQSSTSTRSRPSTPTRSPSRSVRPSATATSPPSSPTPAPPAPAGPRPHRSSTGGTAPPARPDRPIVGPLTRGEHNTKTHGLWTVTSPYPGVFLWRSPHGHWFLSTNHGTQHLGPLPDTGHPTHTTTGRPTIELTTAHCR